MTELSAASFYLVFKDKLMLGGDRGDPQFLDFDFIEVGMLLRRYLTSAYSLYEGGYRAAFHFERLGAGTMFYRLWNCVLV